MQEIKTYACKILEKLQVLNLYQNKEEVVVPQTVLMEVSFRGIHLIDKRKKNVGFFFYKL